MSFGSHNAAHPSLAQICRLPRQRELHWRFGDGQQPEAFAIISSGNSSQTFVQTFYNFSPSSSDNEPWLKPWLLFGDLLGESREYASILGICEW
jgi:hypothetical protein